MTLNIGKMDRYITLRSVAVSVDAYGGRVEAFSDLASVWARITYKKGKEDFEGEKLTSVNNVIFTIRYRDDLSVENEIVYSSNTYKIENLTEFGRQEALQITTTQKD